MSTDTKQKRKPAAGKNGKMTTTSKNGKTVSKKYNSTAKKRDTINKDPDKTKRVNVDRHRIAADDEVEQNKKQKRQIEIKGIILTAVGVLMMVAFYSNDAIGAFGTFVRSFLFGLFGWPAYFVPSAIIIAGILTILSNNRQKAFNWTFIYAFMLFVIVSALFHTGYYKASNYTNLNPFIILGRFYEEAQTLDGGGFFGGLLAMPFLTMFQTLGAQIILSAILLIDIVLLTNVSVAAFLRSIGKTATIGAKKVKGFRHDRQESNHDEEMEYAESSELNSLESPITEKQDDIKKTGDNRKFNLTVGNDDSGPGVLVKKRDKSGNGKKKKSAAKKPLDETDWFFTPDYVQKMKEAMKQNEEKSMQPSYKSGLELGNDDDFQIGSDFETLNKYLEPISGLESRLGTGPESGLGTETVPELIFGSGMSDNDLSAEDESVEDGTNSDKDLPGFAWIKTGKNKTDQQPEPQQTETQQTERQAGKQTDRPTDKQAVRKTGKQLERMNEEKTGTAAVYHYPGVDLLKENSDDKKSVNKVRLQTQETAALLEETLQSFKVKAKVISISRGPSVTRYELQPDVGVKVNTIINLAEDISLKLAASGIRIAPVADKAAIGIEVPNKDVSKVVLRDIIDTEAFKNSSSPLTFAIGKDISGKTVTSDIAKMPHLLVAGATGSGKSVCINCLIISLLFKSSPEDVKLIMIDPKVVELGIYNGIPHLMIPVVTDPKKAAGALAWAVMEMLNRYKAFSEKKVKDLAGYNDYIKRTGDGEKMPRIVIIIDELADLMMAAPKEVEDSICRLTQMARAAGMHLVIATQRPSVDVITGLIKANIPSRIACAVSSQIDSRTILDMAGAEKLLGKGDMLFYPVGEKKPIRVQGAFISESEVEKVVKHIRIEEEVTYDEEMIEQITSAGAKPIEDESQENDVLLPQAVELVVEAGQASTSMIQRRFRVGYARAARIIDQMEARGIVGGFEGSKPRQILISKQQLYEMKL